MSFSSETVRLSEKEFAILRDLVHERTGLFYENDKRDLLADKLSSRVIDRGFNAFIDYYYLLKYGPGEEQEWKNVLDALSVPETYFWRELDQVGALVDIVVPLLLSQGRGEPLRIWSAGLRHGRRAADDRHGAERSRLVRACPD